MQANEIGMIIVGAILAKAILLGLAVSFGFSLGRRAQKKVVAQCEEDHRTALDYQRASLVADISEKTFASPLGNPRINVGSDLAQRIIDTQRMAEWIEQMPRAVPGTLSRSDKRHIGRHKRGEVDEDCVECDYNYKETVKRRELTVTKYTSEGVEKI